MRRGLQKRVFLRKAKTVLLWSTRFVRIALLKKMELSPQGLPIIDLAPATDSKLNLDSLAKDVANACETVGCFYVKNHFIDFSLIDNTIKDFRSFFEQSLEYKMKFKVDWRLDRGYLPFETQNINAFMGRRNLPNDPVEKFAFGPPYECDPPSAENIFPDIPPSLKTNVENYYLASKRLADTLMNVFSIAANAPEPDYFYRNCRHGTHGMRGNFYPGNAKPKPDQWNRFGAHTDISAFTILATDNSTGSLQIRNAQGEWVFADPVPNALFVNLGDVMQRWTNDKWKATEHKVVWPQGDKIEDRLSIVFFVLTNADAQIECVPGCVPVGEKPKYEPISFREYTRKPMNNLSGY